MERGLLQNKRFRLYKNQMQRRLFLDPNWNKPILRLPEQYHKIVLLVSWGLIMGIKKKSLLVGDVYLLFKKEKEYI